MNGIFDGEQQERTSKGEALRPSDGALPPAARHDGQAPCLHDCWPRPSSRSHSILAFFVAALVLSAVITSLYPAVHMRHAVIQEAMLAAVALGLTWRVVGFGGLALGERGKRSVLAAVISLLLVAALAGGSTSLFVSMPSMEYVFEPLPVRIALMIALCLLTGLYEECLFRGLCFNAFRGAFSKHPDLSAAAVQAALFAVMHVSLYEALLLGDAVIWAQVAIKAIQAFLFGLIMAAMAVRTQGLWLPIFLHAVFDCLYLGAGMVMSGVSNAQHFSGMVPDLVMMTVAAVLLACACRACISWLRD